MANNDRQAIDRFWLWFVQSKNRLEKLHRTDQLELVAEEVNPKLDGIDPRLGWEIGPGAQKSYVLVISSEGHMELDEVVQMMLKSAPSLPDWEFRDSRPAKEKTDFVQIPGQEQRFNTSQWVFIPSESSVTGRLDLTICDDDLAKAVREVRQAVIFIYLQQALGEHTALNVIGKVEVEPAQAEHGRRAFPIAEISDYVLWATHREKNPLRAGTIS